MTLVETVKQDLVAAMKAREQDRVGALRMVLSELQKSAKDGSGDELAVLRRERKRRLESAAAFRAGGRDEPAPKLWPATRITGCLNCGLLSTKSGFSLRERMNSSAL